MANTSSELLATTDHGLPLVKIASAAAVAAIAPQLLGFRPRESLILTFFDEQARLQLATRTDLPIDAGTEDEAVGELFDLARHSRWRAVHIAVVTEARVAPLSLMTALRLLAAAGRLDILGCGLVRSGRWLAVDIDGEVAEPGESLSDGKALAATSQLVLAGRSFVADREVFVARVHGTEPATDEIYRVLSDPGAAWVTISSSGRKYSRARLLIENAIFEYLTGGRDRPDPATAAHWIAAFSDSRIREAVLWRLSPAAPDFVIGANHDGVVEALGWLVRAAPAPWSAPVASSLAALAWQGGDGVLAGVAAEYALECDPRNRLATLVDLALNRAAPPAVWIDLMRSMSLSELRTSSAGSRVSPAAAAARGMPHRAAG